MPKGSREDKKKWLHGLLVITIRGLTPGGLTQIFLLSAHINMGTDAMNKGKLQH